MTDLNINRIKLRLLDFEHKLNHEFGCSIKLTIANIGVAIATPNAEIKHSVAISKNKIFNSVINAACKVGQCSLNDLLIKGRKTDIVDLRHISFLIIKEIDADISFKAIGLKFGGRDHSTVMHGVERAKERINIYTHYKEMYNQIKQETWKQLI